VAGNKYKLNDKGELVIINDENSQQPTSVRPTTYVRPPTSVYRNTPTAGQIITGVIFALLALGGIGVCFYYTGSDGILELSRYLFYDYDWVYWCVVAAASLITSIVIGAKAAEFPSGVCSFASMALANITGYVETFFVIRLLLPAISSAEYSKYLVILPYIVIGAVFISSMIFLGIRYNSEYEVVPFDILWSFLVSVATPIAVLIVIAIIMIILAIIFAVLYAIAFIIAIIIFCACGGCS
jgi:hypothetical protein